MVCTTLVTGFDPRGLRWADGLADPAGGSLVCHNDVELSNVVFDNGIAVGFIDFEFTAPGRPVYDVAQFARLCVPIEDEFDQARMGWKPANWPARLRLVADEYGLDQNGRTELLAAMDGVWRSTTGDAPGGLVTMTSSRSPSADTHHTRRQDPERGLGK